MTTVHIITKNKNVFIVGKILQIKFHYKIEKAQFLKLVCLLLKDPVILGLKVEEIITA